MDGILATVAESMWPGTTEDKEESHTGFWKE